MDFIRVTLCEDILTSKKPPSQQGRFEDYLLPVNGVKSIYNKESEPGVFYIQILENYIPKDLDLEFEISHAEATLPNSFVNVIN